MRKLCWIGIVLVLSASVALAQNKAPLTAEAYAYGNALGTITINDLSTDGHVIMLKGVQVWPELDGDKVKEVPEVQEITRQKSSLMTAVIDEQIRRQRQEQNKSTVLNTLLEMFLASQLVDTAKIDDSSQCIEIHWVGDSCPEYFELVDTNNRPTWEERLQQELDVLKIYIERGYTLVISSEIRQGIPPQHRQELHDEINAVKSNTWNGKGLLDPKAAEQFGSPLNIEIH